MVEPNSLKVFSSIPQIPITRLHWIKKSDRYSRPCSQLFRTPQRASFGRYSSQTCDARFRPLGIHSRSSFQVWLDDDGASVGSRASASGEHDGDGTSAPLSSRESDSKHPLFEIRRDRGDAHLLRLGQVRHPPGDDRCWWRFGRRLCRGTK